MRDQQHAEIGAGALHLADAVGDDAERVDVEAGVGLVEDGDLGLEDGHLQDFVALLLAAGEALVEVAVAEARVHPEPLHPLHDREPQFEDREVDALAGREGLAEELHDRDAGDLFGVLEREEHARLAPHVGGPLGDVLALEQDAALRDLVVGTAEQRVGQRGLARAVGPHERVHLTGADDEVDPAQDGHAFDGDVQVLDLEQWRSHGPSRISPTAVGEMCRARGSAVETAFPDSISGITPAWLSEVVGAPVRSIEAVTIGEGVGILGELARLTLDYEDGASGPATVVAKIQSPYAENRAVAMHFRFYEREVSFYRELAADVGIGVPRCYFAEIDIDRAAFTLILEDLGDGRFGDQVAGLDLADARGAPWSVRASRHVVGRPAPSEVRVVAAGEPPDQQVRPGSLPSAVADVHRSIWRTSF